MIRTARPEPPTRLPDGAGWPVRSQPRWHTDPAATPGPTLVLSATTVTKGPAIVISTSPDDASRCTDAGLVGWSITVHGDPTAGFGDDLPRPDADGNWSLTQVMSLTGVYDVTAGCYDESGTERFAYPVLQFTVFDPAATTTTTAPVPASSTTTARPAAAVTSAPAFTG